MRMLGTPGEVSGHVASRLASPARIRILFQHVVDDDLVHPVPYLPDVIRDLRAPHRPSHRIEYGLGCVVDDRAIELGAVAQRLAVQQQVFRVHQQAVVVHQVVQVFRAVEELVVLHTLRNFQRDSPERGDDFAWSGLHSGIFHQAVTMVSFFGIIASRHKCNQFRPDCSVSLSGIVACLPKIRNDTHRLVSSRPC
jgi:hypothetical protein